MLSAVGLERYTATSGNDLGYGKLSATVDTVGQRVVNVEFGPMSIPSYNSERVVVSRELDGLAAAWDKIPGVIRSPRPAPQGQSYARWVTSDSAWSAMIFYEQGLHESTPRAESFKIEEMKWGENIARRVTDSMKGQLRNPESEYYRTPNTACNALPLDSK